MPTVSASTATTVAAELRILGVELDAVLKGLGKIAVIVVGAVVLVAFARRALPRAVARLMNSTRDDERADQRARTLAELLATLAAIVVYSLAAVTVLAQLDISIGPLLAGAGVVGLAVGFGAQQLVKDVITGFFILAEDQYAVGDQVTGAGVSGEVETLSLRLTRIRGDDGVLHHVRNGDLGVVSNASRGWALATVSVPLPKGMDATAAQAALAAAIAGLRTDGGLEGLLLSDARVVGVTDISGDTVSIGITARSTPDGASRVRRAILGAATRALAAGVSAAPPRKAAVRRRSTTRK